MFRFKVIDTIRIRIQASRHIIKNIVNVFTLGSNAIISISDKFSFDDKTFRYEQNHCMRKAHCVTISI